MNGSMRPRGSLVPLLGAALLAGACKARPGDGASLRGAAREKTTMTLMEEVARARFEPPADGRLTGPQVEMYLKVKERALSIRETLRERKGDLATADLRAAQELGHNPKELQWVEERVLEAQAARVGEELDRRIDASRRRFVQGLREERRTATDPARRAEIDRLLATFAPSLEQTAPAGPAVHHNADLLARYEDRLGRLEVALNEKR